MSYIQGIFLDAPGFSTPAHLYLDLQHGAGRFTERGHRRNPNYSISVVPCIFYSAPRFNFLTVLLFSYACARGACTLVALPLVGVWPECGAWLVGRKGESHPGC